MAEATELPVERWWQWHLGDRMARHQHPGEEGLPGCSWPDCAWHGYRPGEDNFIESLPEVAPQSAALRHVMGLHLDEGIGGFVYERDADIDDEAFFDDEFELLS